MICYITKNRAQLNSLLFLFSLALPSCLLVIYAFVMSVIIFMSSHFSTLCRQSNAVEYALFYAFIKLLSSCFTKLLVIYTFGVLAVLTFVFSDSFTLRQLCYQPSSPLCSLIFLPCIVILSLLQQRNTLCFVFLLNCHYFLVFFYYCNVTAL